MRNLYENIDQMSAMAAMALENGRDDFISKSVVGMCWLFRKSSALSIAFSFAIVEASRRSTFSSSSKKVGELSDGYIISSLISADVMMMESLGITKPSCGDLLDHWSKNGDEIFIV